MDNHKLVHETTQGAAQYTQKLQLQQHMLRQLGSAIEESIQFMKQQIQNAQNTVRGVFQPEVATRITEKLLNKLWSE